ncbi:MAG: hypothetical protein ACRDFX_12935 [Chloroflexota bacterium]
MTERVLAYLRTTHQLVEPPAAACRRRHTRPHAIRTPRDYRIERSGDLRQVDTAELHPSPA